MGMPRLSLKFAVGLLAAGVLIYAALLVALVAFQRHLMYFPSGPHGPASAFGLPHAETLSLKTTDGETIVAWYQPATAGKPLYLYFHGNGGTLAIRGGFLRRLSADGSGFLAIDYRGYGGSTGSPSEQGLIHDAEAAYAKACTLGYPPARLVVIGESLGTGVAIALAARHPVGALVLDSAYSSAASIAADQYWMFPVKLLMRDTFDSFDRIDAVTAPKLFLHGTQDPIIPLASGQKLFAKANPPKTFIAIPGGGHMVLWRDEVMSRMKAWVAALSLT
jgi:fermentation-respiration switch protein FrsA (DUF1100 family)